MSGLYTGKYRIGPGGLRDTPAVHEMREAAKPQNPREQAAQRWLTMPLTLRSRWIMAALHCSGVEAMGRAECGWDELTPRERMLIGAAARREAGALV